MGKHLQQASARAWPHSKGKLPCRRGVRGHRARASQKAPLVLRIQRFGGKQGVAAATPQGSGPAVDAHPALDHLPFNLRLLSAPRLSSTLVQGPREVYLPLDTMSTMELPREGASEARLEGGPSWAVAGAVRGEVVSSAQRSNWGLGKGSLSRVSH